MAQCASGNSDVQNEEEKKISGSGENQITFFQARNILKQIKSWRGRVHWEIELSRDLVEQIAGVRENRRDGN